MKIFHVSDTHLGFSEYHKIDAETGLNQREQDFYNAWDQIIAAIFTHQPDVIVHAGDLFHTPRPSNRAIHVAVESIQKISDAGIPMVIVSGNHETPRIRLTGSIFETISLFPNIYTAFTNQYERFRIKSVDFHCIPHFSLSEDLNAALEKLHIKSDSQANVLVTHGAWAGKKTFGMGEFNEQRLPDIEGVTGLTFDYIALGHYHRHIAVKDHAWYSGSTERTSLNEHNSQCGYLLVDLDKNEYDYHEITTRPMIKFPAIDCQDLTTTDIYSELEKLITPDIQDAIVQLGLNNIEDDTFVKLDIRAIDDIFKNAFVLEKQLVRKAHDGQQHLQNAKIESLPVEFERYIETIDHTELDAAKLKKLGATYLADES